MRRYCQLLAVALVLTACEQSPQGDPTETAATAAEATRYACPDGSFVEARYPTTDSAEVTFGGQTIDMRIAISASGARYVGGGWEWWTKGMSEGTLSRLEAGEDTASAPGLICTVE